MHVNAWPQQIDNDPIITQPIFKGLKEGSGKKTGICAVVVLCWNTKELTLRCLKKIVQNTNPKHYLIIVDNASYEPGATKAFFEITAPFSLTKRLFFAQQQNKFYSAGFNFGIGQIPTEVEHVILCSSDCEPKSPNWLQYFTDALSDTYDVAGLTVTEDVKPFQKEVYFDRPITYLNTKLYTRISNIINNEQPYLHTYQYCMAIRKEALIKLGGYLEQGRFYQHHSDWEWSMRMQALGLNRVNVMPNVHHWHQMSGLFINHKDKYDMLMRDLKDPIKECEYLEKGRPLWETL